MWVRTDAIPEPDDGRPPPSRTVDAGVGATPPGVIAPGIGVNVGAMVAGVRGGAGVAIWAVAGAIASLRQKNTQAVATSGFRIPSGFDHSDGLPTSHLALD
jgi:hypothetical protein